MGLGVAVVAAAAGAGEKARTRSWYTSHDSFTESSSTLNCCPAVSPSGTIIEWYDPSGATTRTRSPPLMPAGTVTVSRVVTGPIVTAPGREGYGCAAPNVRRCSGASTC